MMRKFQIGTWLAALSIVSTAAFAASNTVIDKSIVFTATTAGQKRFADYIDLKSGQERLPLRLTIYNGSDTTPGFTYLRLTVGGRILCSEKDLQGKSRTLDMTGRLGPGNTQVLADLNGVAGATFQWVLTAPKLAVSEASPSKVKTGETLTLKGGYFSPKKTDSVVMFEGDQAEIVSASPNALVIKVPSVKPGQHRVTVSSGGDTTEPVAVTVTGAPPAVLNSISLGSAPCGTEVTISGTNFSNKPGSNKVFFGQLSAQITHSSTTSITCIIPDMPEPTWYVPVWVQVDDVKSVNALTMNIQKRVW